MDWQFTIKARNGMSFLHGDRLFGEEVANEFEKLNSDLAVVSFKYEKVFDVSLWLYQRGLMKRGHRIESTPSLRS